MVPVFNITLRLPKLCWGLTETDFGLHDIFDHLAVLWKLWFVQLLRWRRCKQKFPPRVKVIKNEAHTTIAMPNIHTGKPRSGCVGVLHAFSQQSSEHSAAVHGKAGIKLNILQDV
jgi:hypothetical protein